MRLPDRRRVVLGSLALALLAGAAFCARAQNPSCVVEEIAVHVHGDSMTPVLTDGMAVSAKRGFYACHEPARGDIALISIAAGKHSYLVKTIRGLPGDAFSFKTENGKTSLLLNQEILTNSNGEPYQFDENAARLLRLYERDYHGVIPPEAYLVLGENADGSFDSSAFGLIGKRELLGKIVSSQ